MTRTLDPEALLRHLDRLHRAARSLTRDAVDAEDLVQETCARLLARSRRIERDDEAAYLLTALRNTYIDRFRRLARRGELVGIPDGLDVPDQHASEAFVDRVRSREVFGWISELPQALAAPLVAVDIGSLSVSEASSALDVGERELRQRLARARIAVGVRLRA